MDTLRVDDLNSMRLMAKELSKLRKDDKALKKSNTLKHKEKTTENTNRPPSGGMTNVQIRNRI